MVPVIPRIIASSWDHFFPIDAVCLCKLHCFKCRHAPDSRKWAQHTDRPSDDARGDSCEKHWIGITISPASENYQTQTVYCNHAAAATAAACDLWVLNIMTCTCWINYYHYFPESTVKIRACSLQKHNGLWAVVQDTASLFGPDILKSFATERMRFGLTWAWLSMSMSMGVCLRTTPTLICKCSKSSLFIFIGVHFIVLSLFWKHFRSVDWLAEWGLLGGAWCQVLKCAGICVC